MNELFVARDISQSYSTGASDLTILDHVSLTISPGEMTAIVGASGSGKTTLLQILGTLAEPSGGEIYFQGEKLTGKDDAYLARFRNQSLGFIFQFHHLLPEFSALENVMMPALIAGKSKKEMVDPARELLERVELGHRTEEALEMQRRSSVLLRTPKG